MWLSWLPFQLPGAANVIVGWWLVNSMVVPVHLTKEPDAPLPTGTHVVVQVTAATKVHIRPLDGPIVALAVKGVYDQQVDPVRRTGAKAPTSMLLMAMQTSTCGSRCIRSGSIERSSRTATLRSV
jgi:hypothetical protein